VKKPPFKVGDEVDASAWDAYRLSQALFSCKETDPEIMGRCIVTKIKRERFSGSGYVVNFRSIENEDAPQVEEIDSSCLKLIEGGSP
jgi:hypothetical protein